MNIDLPLVGVCDAPHNANFERVLEPLSHRRICIFAYFNAWMRGQTLKLTSLNFGCQGSGYWFFGKENRDRNEFVEFLVKEEGLKCSNDLMNSWLDVTLPYKSKNKCVYIGLLKNNMSEF